MSNIISTESTILFSDKRQPDGRIEITAVVSGAEQFVDVIDVQDPDERNRYVIAMIEKYPGVADDRATVRAELLKIARKTKIDLRFEICGKINGVVRCSARLWRGSRFIEAVPLNLIDGKQTAKAVATLAPLYAGPGASKKKIQATMREMHKLFKSQAQMLLTSPPQSMTGRNGREYKVDDRGILWFSKRDGEVPISNFSGRIVTEIYRDDGSGDDALDFELEVKTTSGTERRVMPAAVFREMNWALEMFGTRGRVEPGQSENVANAILAISGEPPRKRQYICTGWVKSEEGWGYMHAGGAIMAGGLSPIDVRFDGPLKEYRLPEPPTGAALIACIRSSLKMIELGPAEITYPIYCAIWRAVLNRSEFTTHLVGESGAYKSEAMALCVQHFGKEMVRLNQPAKWTDTDNSLGELSYLGKDALLGIDEYKLLGNATDDKLRRKADDTIQGQGNGGGKNRMRAEGGLRANHPARATLMSTGEQVPGTNSCRARQFIILVCKGDFDLDKLTACQNAALAGEYVGANAGYIQWLAQDDRIEQVRKDFAAMFPRIRARASADKMHARTPGIVADLYGGWLFFLQFAFEKGAIDAQEQKQYQDAAWAALGVQAERQRQWQAETDSALRYVELLESAISAGEAHLAGADGNCPGEDLAQACGWWRASPTHTWEGQGTRAGYLTSEAIALLPDATARVVQRMAGNGSGGPIGSERDLRRLLNAKGLLITEVGEKFQRLTVRRALAGRFQTVLLLRHEALSLSGARNVRNEPDVDVQKSIFDLESGVKS